MDRLAVSCIAAGVVIGVLAVLFSVSLWPMFCAYVVGLVAATWTAN